MSRIRIALPVLLLLLAACPQRTAVWIAEGSTARDLTFVLGQKEGRERRIQSYVRVDRCGPWYRDSAMWIASADTSRVTYGVTGPGATEQQPARPLVPGCYSVMTGGTGSVAFAVDSLGGVTQLDSVPAEVFAP